MTHFNKLTPSHIAELKKLAQKSSPVPISTKIIFTMNLRALPILLKPWCVPVPQQKFLQ